MRCSESRTVQGALLCLVVALTAYGQEPDELLSEPLAAVFGAAPLVSGVRLSPDGQRISFVQMHPDGYPLVNVFDTRSGTVATVMAGEPNGYDIRWCGWANDERLLCSLRYIEHSLRGYVAARTRLAAVNADGSDAILLLQDDRALRTTQFQDRIVDWLTDDPEHVLLELRSRVVRLNIYTSKLQSVDSAQDFAINWIADGYGKTRLYAAVSRTHRTWFVREREDGAWSSLHQKALADLEDRFAPFAFDRDANEVLFYDRHDGRIALFALELDNDRARRLVYAHPRVDVGSTYRIGRDNRVVAAVAIEDRPVMHFFEPGIERVHEMLASEFPGMSVNVIDEDWAERRYLVFVNSDRDPGTYYIFDTEELELVRFARAFPALGERELAAVQPISYPAADGTDIPAYLTLPPEGPSGAGVVLPHGGPSSRDYWQFDFLAQFLATRGYAVLQSNYRGSGGYGEEWSGDGGFQDWRQAVGDIADGARHLAAAGFADAGRLCVVGWSYGGYAALLSAIEHEPLYRCVASIAGVSDPALLARNAGNFVGAVGTQAFIGSGDSDVRQLGSPLRRAAEIYLPTLLFHPQNDVNVALEHSVQLRDAMQDEGAQVQLIEYEHAEHSIGPSRYRIDMLARLGDFLDTHTGTPTSEFYSGVAVADAIEIVDFGIDSSRPNGICSDARFMTADGRAIRDGSGRPRETRGDATDCRALLADGEIVLMDSFRPDYSGNVRPRDRVTVFVDPALQTGVAIESVDGESRGRRQGAPVAYVRPGYRIVSVRATEQDYRCTVGIDGATNAEQPAYIARPAGRDAEVSLVSIPAYAGRFYRIHADVIDDVLLVRVTDAAEDRVIVDQRELVATGCR